MKKGLSVLLCIVLIFSFCACGRKEAMLKLNKSKLSMKIGETYQFSVIRSGEKVSPDLLKWKSSDESVVMIASGKAVALNEGDAVITAAYKSDILSCIITVENSKADNTSTPAANTNESGLCKHEYTSKVISPTCTQKGYTIYTCNKCSYEYKSSYTDASHNFKNYKCASCGKLDKTHSYEILVNWILENGTHDGDFCYVEKSDSAAIVYYKPWGYVYLQNTYTDMFNKEYNSTIVYLIQVSDIKADLLYNYEAYWEYPPDSPYYPYLFHIKGFFDPNTFTESSALTYTSYENNAMLSKDELFKDTKEIFVGVLWSVNDLLTGKYKGVSNSGLTIDDLGFTAL